jgi:hypothetical protein
MQNDLHLPGLVHPVIMEDPIVHDASHPFCSDPACPCHRDKELYDEYLLRPFASGQISDQDALRLFWGEGVRGH